jgi:hypothetical protein
MVSAHHSSEEKVASPEPHCWLWNPWTAAWSAAGQLPRHSVAGIKKASFVQRHWVFVLEMMRQGGKSIPSIYTYRLHPEEERALFTHLVAQSGRRPVGMAAGADEVWAAAPATTAARANTALRACMAERRRSVDGSGR